MPDDHVHEVVLSDGTKQTTGPPLTSTTDEVPEAPAGMPGEQLRAPEKRKALSAVDVAGQEADEAEHAAKALEAADVSLLPDHAKKIWQRMFQSAKRYSQDERYSAALAWRAVRQKYALAPSKRTQEQLRYLLKAMAPATERPKVRGKTLAAGTIAERPAGAYVVRVSDEQKADELYERVEQFPLHSEPDVLVTVGFAPGNHRNILNVRVPDRLVSGQPGGAGAVKWVRNNWAEIWKVGKGLQPSQVVTTKRQAASPTAHYVAFKRFLRKEESGATYYVDDPRKATKRIAYGVVYPAWEVDLQGEYATEAQVEAMAHKFMEQHGVGGEMHSRWEMDGGKSAGVPVESFLARRGDPDFDAGDWVMGVKFHPEVWEKIASGVYTGYSIGGAWGVEPVRRAAGGDS